MVGRYQIIGRLGQSGDPEALPPQRGVYAAIDVDLGRRVALKMLPAGTATPTAPLVHRNIVTVYNVGEHEGKPYLVMEFLEGAPLLEFLEQGAARTLNQNVGLLLQLCDGLQAVHDRGIAHGDLEASDVFVLKDGCVKILDLGLGQGAPASDILAAVQLFHTILGADATQNLKDVLAKTYRSMAELRSAIDEARQVKNSGQYRTLAAAFDRYKKIEGLIDERRALGRRLNIADIERTCDAEAARLALKFPLFARSTRADLLPVSEQDETAALAELQSWHNEQLAAVAVLRTVSGQK